MFATGDDDQVSVPLDALDELWPEGEATSDQLLECIDRFGDWSRLVDYPGA